jgi:hypothetical protein
MRNFVLAGVGLPGATVLGLAAWVFKVSHEAPSNAVHPVRLLYGADEYWNGEYPEDERPW